METKINTSFQYRKSYTKGRGAYARINAYANSAGTRSINADTFTRSYFDSSSEIKNNSTDFYAEHREELERFRENLKNFKIVKVTKPIVENGDYAGQTKLNFEVIDKFKNELNENLPKWLENSGVPSDVTFEFDYNINTQKAEITKISDDKYLENVETVINEFNIGMYFTAFASRVMNGYISSAYYSPIASNLENCYGQDINDLYIDEKGNLCGANENLQKAIEASKRGEEYYPNTNYYFPAKNVEGIIKRLISDENITPNISRMGYDGKSIYTNDGEFKFGKDFDPNLFGEEKYVMRGSISLVISHGYDRWLENEEKFY